MCSTFYCIAQMNRARWNNGHAGLTTDKLAWRCCSRHSTSKSESKYLPTLREMKGRAVLRMDYELYYLLLHLEEIEFTIQFKSVGISFGTRLFVLIQCRFLKSPSSTYLREWNSCIFVILTSRSKTTRRLKSVRWNCFSSDSQVK